MVSLVSDKSQFVSYILAPIGVDAGLLILVATCKIVHDSLFEI